MKVLITYFEPFGKSEMNATMEVVSEFPSNLDGVEVYTKLLQVVKDKCVDTAISEIEKLSPDVVISLGESGIANCINLEKIAVNLNEFRIPDNDGNQPRNETISSNGENAYFTTLPVDGLVNHLVSNCIPAKVSYTAGTYVCNHLMYGVLHYIKTNNLNIKSGFIHIPRIYEQVLKNATAPAMAKSTIINALVKSIEYMRAN